MGIHKLRKQGRGRGLAKCLCYYISLCSKLAYGGGRGVKNWLNFAYVVYGCPPSLWHYVYMRMGLFFMCIFHEKQDLLLRYCFLETQAQNTYFIHLKRTLFYLRHTFSSLLKWGRRWVGCGKWGQKLAFCRTPCPFPSRL